MTDTVKRMNYYDHQFLRQGDFLAEQNYHLSMRRLHNSELHTPGILDGLDVTPVVGGSATAVAVKSGMAIDSAGREIVLPENANLELGGTAVGATVYITIAYHEDLTDSSADAGGPGFTRVTERPTLASSITAPVDPNTLILARVPRTQNGLGTIDVSDRKQAGAKLGLLSSLTANTLILSNGSVPAANWPALSCSAANQASFANAGLLVNGNVGIGTTTPGVKLEVNGALKFTNAGSDANDGRIGSALFGTGLNLVGIKTDATYRKVSIWGEITQQQNDGANSWTGTNLFKGSVGIGTTAPTLGKLQTAGVVGNTAAVFAGDGQGIALVASWPNIGFNSYFNGGWKAINTGYGGIIGVDEGVGGLHFRTADTVTGQGTAHDQQERMRISNTGNVGIGTSSPNRLLQLTKSASGALGPELVLQNSTPAAPGNAAQIAFQTDNGPGAGTYNAAIKAVQDGLAAANSGYTALTFGTYGGGGTPDERMRITSTGNVGIGTPGPADRLEVSGGSVRAKGSSDWANGFYAQSASGGIATLRVGAKAAYPGIPTEFGFTGTDSAIPFMVRAGGEPVMTFATNTNVGIGTNTPGVKLDVRGQVQMPSLSFQDAAGVGYRDNWLGMADNVDGAKNKWLHIGGITDNTDGKGARRRIGLFADPIMLAGSVGIGTASPGSRLDIVGGAVRTATHPSGLGLYVTADSQPDSLGIEFRHTNGSQGIGFGYNTIYATGSNADQPLSIHARGAAALTLAANAATLTIGGTQGNVGIGLTNPDRSLTMFKTGAGTGVYANVKNSNHEILIGVDVAAIVSAMTNSDLQLRTQNTNRVVISGADGSFNVLTNAFKPGGGPWSTPSDEKLKKNISPLQGVLDRLLSLRGVGFEWKDPEQHGNLTGAQMGLVAQEVAGVFPEWIGKTSDGTLTLSIRGFEALTIEAFRELKQEISATQIAVREIRSRLGVEATDPQPAVKATKSRGREAQK